MLVHFYPVLLHESEISNDWPLNKCFEMDHHLLRDLRGIDFLEAGKKLSEPHIKLLLKSFPSHLDQLGVVL